MSHVLFVIKAGETIEPAKFPVSGDMLNFARFVEQHGGKVYGRGSDYHVGITS